MKCKESGVAVGGGGEGGGGEVRQVGETAGKDVPAGKLPGKKVRADYINAK